MSWIYSMTGFASMRGEAASGSIFTLTVKSVNHRFLDIQLRLPPSFDSQEMLMRRMLKDGLKRGHVEVTLQLERAAGAEIELNAALLEAYVEAFRRAAKISGIAAEPDLNAMLRLPGVMRANGSGNTEEIAEEIKELQAAVLAEIVPLMSKLKEVRSQEGGLLAAELDASMLRLRRAAEEMSELRRDVREMQFERLRGRLAELTQGVMVSEDRLLAEAAVLAEKSDVVEEIVRLRAHVEHFQGMLAEGGEVGKRLDFLLQEMNREANTMLSKTGGAAGANSLRITELGLEMKAEVERAREQVQNLE